MKKIRMIFFCVIALAAATVNAHARDWSDLDEGEHEIVGSEYERKFSVPLGFIAEKGSWENHSTWHFLNLIGAKNYPRYASSWWLPFYYHLESKIDRREKTFAWPIVPYYRVRDLDHERMSIIPFYNEKTTRTSESWNLLYLFYKGKSWSDTFTKSYVGILPLMYYGRYHSDAGGEDRMGLVTPLFIRFQSEKRGATPEYQHMHFSPLHYYHRKRVGDERSRTWGAPLIPLVYYHSSNAERHFNLGWLLFDLSWERATGRIQRSFLTPLWYYSHDYTSENNFSTFSTTPLWFFRHYIGPRESGDTTEAAHVERRQFWFPIVPLYYRFTSTDTGSHTNVIGVLDWMRDTDRVLSRLWITPFAFYRSGTYFHFLPPFAYMSWQKFTDSYHTGIWGYHHVRLSETDRNQVAMRRWWAPIVPLVYSYSSPAEHHVNVLGPLFDIHWKHDKLHRFFSAPFWFFHRDHFSESSFETSTASVFHFYRHYHGPREGFAGTDTQPIDRTQWWAPIVPLLYHSRYAGEGTHTNLLWFFDWAHDEDGSYRRFWLTPLAFHKRDSYFHILPPLAYMSWQNGTENYHAGIWGFAYSSPSENRSAWWFPIIPVYYHSQSPSAGSYHNLFWLLGFSWRPDGSFSYWRLWPLAYWKTGEGGTRYLMPLYVRPGGWTEQDGYSFGLPGLPYYCRWEGGETRVRHWMPLVWYWKDLTLFGKEHTSGTIWPGYISYKDDTYEIDIYLLFSKSINMGPLSPSLMLGVGNRENTWYVDTEWSFLYNVVSWSTRTPIRNPFRDRTMGAGVPKAIAADAGAADTADASRPHVTRRREISREDSLNFFGWKALFGWICWERADTRKHFRLIPLAWFSWDSASDSEVTNVFPLWFSYKDPETEYFVLYPLLLPVYGMSRDGDSWFKAYAVNLFWNEYNADTHQREMTLLWPFFNWYWTKDSAPDGSVKSGWRVFPVIWHKYNRDADGFERSRTISPVYYGYSTATPENKWERRMTISPLHYYWNERRNESGYSNRSWSFFFPIIPLFYMSHNETQTQAREGTPASGNTESTNFLMPFYYYTSSSDTRWDRSESSLLIPILLTYYTTRTVPNYNHNSNQEDRTDSTLFFPGYYRSIDGRESHHNIAFLFDMGFNTREDSGYNMLIPLYYYSWDNPKPGQEGGVDRSFMFPLLPLVCMYEGNSRSGYVFLPFILSYYGWERQENTYVILGLWWTNSDPGRSEHYAHFLPFWMYWSHTSYTNPAETDRTVLVPFLPLLCLYDGTSSNGYWLSLATLSYHGWMGNSRRTTIGGLFWKYNNYNSTDNYLHFLPIWMYWEDLRRSEYYYFFPIAGLYWHSRPGYRHVNWLLMMDYERWDSTDTTELDFLLGIVSSRSTPNRREFEVALGLLASYENTYNSPNWHARLLWFGYERAGNRSTLNFLPLFYRRTIEGGSGYDLYRFPLAFWHYESNGEDIFHTVGFGLGYYRNRNASAHEDLALVLLGSLFYYEEKPVRNNESWGSLWGYLWEYEQEEGGAYNKFTILKGIFKRVNDHGNVYYWFR